MPRPKTKSELLDLSQTNFDRLNDYIDRLSKEEQLAEFPQNTMNRNIRDVLGHLYHWHLMMLDWYTVGMKGKKPDMPAKGYTWKTTSTLNHKIWELYTQTALDTVRELLGQSHKAQIDLIDRHSDEELFTKKQYPWTGSTSLAAYLISANSSHYDWALKLMKKARKL